jgi:aspartyl-tRNA(Asn)/glutamyl-tRNA(Gln) amidotransferase subunit C
MEKLNQIDTAGVEPLAHVVDIVNAFREDYITSSPFTETLLQNAPAREKNFFKVPKIIE